MDLELKDKVIIVTGGDKGIGFGISQVLAQEGAKVIIIGRTERDVRTAVDTLKSQGGSVDYEIAELTDSKACKRVVSSVIKKH